MDSECSFKLLLISSVKGVQSSTVQLGRTKQNSSPPNLSVRALAGRIPWIKFKESCIAFVPTSWPYLLLIIFNLLKSPKIQE